MLYKRILLKLSGESLMGAGHYGIDPERVKMYAGEVVTIHRMGVQISIVIGGGNIFRGLKGVSGGMDRIDGDYMGMLATVINSIALKSTLNGLGIRTTLLTSFEMGPVAAVFSGEKAIRLMEEGSVVIIAGGTGNPLFTTDTASALRAAEIRAAAFFKGTRVDGVYSADPEKNPDATRFETLTFSEAYERNLKIMDLTAFTLCMENRIPVVVFDMNVAGNLERIIRGENTGTLIR